MTFNPLDPQILAQEVHGAFGFGVFLALYYRVLPLLGPGAFWVGLLLFYAVVVLKEALFDPRFEGPTEPLWPAGVVDLLFYVLGTGLAVALALG
jgi:hypothetical protein